MSTLRVNNITDTSGGSSSLSVPGAAKAWVNFNGTGTVAIRAQMNVSSITDNGTGDYTVNFTTALADANYIVAGTVGQYQNGNGAAGAVVTYNSGTTVGAATNKTASGVRVVTLWGNATINDSDQVYVSIFR